MPQRSGGSDGQQSEHAWGWLNAMGVFDFPIFQSAHFGGDIGVGAKGTYRVGRAAAMHDGQRGARVQALLGGPARPNELDARPRIDEHAVEIEQDSLTVEHEGHGFSEQRLVAQKE